MKTTKKPASSSKIKKNVTLSGKAAKSLKDKKRDSSVAPKGLPQNDKPPTETRVEIKPAKGRPMLTWVGKKPLRHATTYPAQLVESFNAQSSIKNRKSEIWTDWSKDIPQTGLLFHGDNKDVLAHLLANGFRGKVKLIYIDPPFDSGADYVRKISLRSEKGAVKIEGETYTLGEQIQYGDIWAKDNYLQFLYERLLLLRELLTDDGNIFVQVDDKRGHYIKIILDEIMGSDNYVNDIVWHKGREGGGGSDINPPLPTEYQNIYLYAKNKKERFWNPPRGPYKASTLTSLQQDDKGWYYERGRMGRKPKPWEVAAGSAKKTYVSDDPKEDREAVITRLTSPNAQYVLIGDVWNAELIKNSPKTDYPTEKPEALLEVITNAATAPGDIVLDAFLGSGTTAATAQKLGRRWIGADINKGAIQTASKRLQGVIQEQVESAKSKIQALPGMEEKETPTPAQFGFSVYRVNDYDLQIQHNEAFNLAVEHLGMTRTKTDAFFDGTLGRKLVKIVPFNHPVTPLDLEEVKRELNNRPEEARDIVVVSLGKEVAVEMWLGEWNKLRKQGNTLNKIEVIELRSDPKYGGFFTHEPAKAKVSFKREKDNVEITIDDFISLTILERLKQQNKDNPLFQPQVSDWRSMVDSVMIDSAYDGKVFNITLADVPEKKNDLVEGKYIVEAKKGETVAVKVTDMLGEEVLVIKSS